MTTHNKAAKTSPAAKKPFSPQATIIKEMSVNTDDTTPTTADEVDYDSFCDASLIRGGFIFVKSLIN